MAVKEVSPARITGRSDVGARANMLRRQS